MAKARRLALEKASCRARCICCRRQAALVSARGCCCGGGAEPRMLPMRHGSASGKGPPASLPSRAQQPARRATNCAHFALA